MLQPYVESYVGYHYAGFPPGEHMGLPSRHLTFIVTFDAPLELAQLPDGSRQRESFETLVERQLNLVRDTSGQYAQRHLKEDNNVKQMVVAGSKGSFINILQMSVCQPAVRQGSPYSIRVLPSYPAPLHER